jgi:manganese/iron transport system permease protein/iron/zinc/copper transport system permease protein
MSVLLDPYAYGFFRNGLIVATVAGGLCGLLGVFVVLKGMSYIGHGLSHAIFGGYAASALIGVNFVLGAGTWGVASALMIGGVTRRRVIGADAAIGVITTASFALGLALFALFGRRGQSFDAALFGSILGVGTADVWGIAIVTVIVGAIVFFAYRPLLFSTFDPEVAEVSGVPTARVDALLMLMLAASILATMQVLGVTLVAAALVIPATIARMLTNSFATMLLLSTAIGTAMGFVGMNLSYHLDVQSGATIVLVGAAAFAVTFAVGGVSGRRRAGGIAAH